MTILAVDPGMTESAWLVFDGRVLESGIEANEAVLARLYDGSWWVGGLDAVVFEQIESYGMPVGREVFETVFWTGRFFEQAKHKVTQPSRLSRQKIKLHLCGSPRATDANIRMALLDRWGGRTAAMGKKSAPGPLYGIKTHLWAALGLAVAFSEGAK